MLLPQFSINRRNTLSDKNSVNAWMLSIVAKVQHAADCDTLYIYPYTLDGGVHSADGRNQRHVVLSRLLIGNVL